MTSDSFIGNFIAEHNIAQFNVTTYSDAIKIDDVRGIKKKLSMKVMHDELYVFQNSLTVEAQNALLKSIEEVGEKVHFIFCVSSRDQLIPTVRSRCLEIYLSTPYSSDETLTEIIKKLDKTGDMWCDIDTISQHLKSGGDQALLGVLRQLLLDNLHDPQNTARYYTRCEEAIKTLHLIEKNNVSRNSVLERIFMQLPQSS